MEIEIILGIVLLFSLIANFLLFRLAMWQSKDLTLVSDNVGDLVEMIGNYRNHLRDIYQMDAFYGDETLEGLMTHTNALTILLEDQYGNVINITEPIEYKLDKEDEDVEEESTEKEKHVLYAGSRRRDS